MPSEAMTGEIVADLRSFFASSLDGQVPGDTDDVFAMGYVNSLFALQLVTYVEGAFHLTVSPEDLDLDNFRTIERIAAFVLRKQAQPPRAGSSGEPQSTGTG